MQPLMLRSSIGHRRHSITHRAVQRLRELVPGMEQLDDEGMRDRLDASLAEAQESGRAVRTLDAMLGEPQVLVPVSEFGETLYAIIKEETVVTVLPRNHGEEIIARGKALEERVANGHAPEPPERSAPPHRRPALASRPAPAAPAAPPRQETMPLELPVAESTPSDRNDDLVILQRNGGRAINGPRPEPERPALSSSARRRPLRSPGEKELPAPPPRPEDNPIAGVLYDALRAAERRSRVRALARVLDEQDGELEFLEAWDRLRSAGMPSTTAMGEFIEACRATTSVNA